MLVGQVQLPCSDTARTILRIFLSKRHQYCTEAFLRLKISLKECRYKVYHPLVNSIVSMIQEILINFLILGIGPDQSQRE